MNNASSVTHGNINTTTRVNVPKKYCLPEKMVVPALIISGIAFSIFSIAAYSIGLSFTAVLVTGVTSFVLLAAAALKLITNKPTQNVSQNNQSTPISTSKPAPKLTNYDTLPNKEEFKNISFIATSLGSQSVVTLPFSRNTLKEARRQTGNIHPLRWLSTAMTDEKLKCEMKKLYERRLGFGQSIVWNEFFEDYSKTFTRQVEKNNFACYLDKFAADLKLDSKLLHKIVAEKRWEDFFKVVFETLDTKP